jgi:hypothetical protein
MHLKRLQGDSDFYFAEVTKLLKLQLNTISRLNFSLDRCWMIKYNMQNAAILIIFNFSKVQE